MSDEFDRLDYGEMKVCAVCGEIYGEFSFINNRQADDDWQEPERYYQECDCRARAGGASALYPQRMKISLNLDFAEFATLCYCCGRELIPSGSRYSSFFCGYCGEIIRGCAELDRRLLWIPLGRHGIMNCINGVLLRGSDIGDEQKIKDFASASNGYFDRIEELRCWKKAVVRQELEEAGFPAGVDVALAAYLTAASRDPYSKQRLLWELAAHFYEKYGEAPAAAAPANEEDENPDLSDDEEDEPEDTGDEDEPGDEQDADELGEDGVESDGADEEQTQGEPAEEVQPTYTPDREIACSFYTLAIRNDALELKYPGGLNGYLENKGCCYNDDIVTQCYMAPEFDEDLDALTKAGLVGGEDFILFDCDEGLGKDYLTFHPGVDWLLGYSLNAQVMIFRVKTLCQIN